MEMDKAQKTVAVVGVGITSIMVALKLQEEGFLVSLYTKGPDPRIGQDAEQYGSTGNGRMGRFITGFEGETYLSDTPMYPNMSWAFQHPIYEGGWLAKPIDQYSPEDQEWLKKRYKATLDHEKVHKLFEEYYVVHNRESIQMWQELFKNKNFLFEKCNTTDPYGGVLRLYDNEKLFESTLQAHEKYNFLKEKLSPYEVAERFPVYSDACKEKLIVGGLIAEGFSLNIQQFCQNVISYLETQGVAFQWNTEVKKIEIKDGVVQGLRTNDDKFIVSENYSINPGAYDPQLLDNTSVKGKIGGVAGRWLMMPRPEGYDIPTKIHGDKRDGFPVIDNNLTPCLLNGKRMIAVGGGYVYVGSNPKEYYAQEVYKIVDAENERTIDLYLRDFYRKAKEAGETQIWHNTCVRSFTYNDEPIHEIIQTTNNGFLTITAGTNTGTTTIAPYLAKWTTEVMKRS